MLLIGAEGVRNLHYEEQVKKLNLKKA